MTAALRILPLERFRHCRTNSAYRKQMDRRVQGIAFSQTPFAVRRTHARAARGN